MSEWMNSLKFWVWGCVFSHWLISSEAEASFLAEDQKKEVTHLFQVLKESSNRRQTRENLRSLLVSRDHERRISSIVADNPAAFRWGDAERLQGAAFWQKQRDEWQLTAAKVGETPAAKRPNYSNKASSLLSVHMLIHWHRGKHIHVVNKCRQLPLTWTSVCSRDVVLQKTWHTQLKVHRSLLWNGGIACIQGIVWSINTGPYWKTNWCLCSQSCCWCKRSFMSDRLIRKPEVLRDAVTMQLAEVRAAALGNLFVGKYLSER